MATIRDVSKLAGVSATSVSLVLSGKFGTRIREDTARRVRDAARRLRYEPNVTARRLRSRRRGRRRTFYAGFVFTPLIDQKTAPYYSEILNGMQAEAMQHGYHLVVGSGFASTTEKLGYLRRLNDDIDGWLLGGVVEDDILDWSREARIPVVILGGGTVRGDFDCVVPDDFEAGRLSAHHLLDLGHERLAFLGYPSDSHSLRSRVAGFRERLAQAGAWGKDVVDYAEPTRDAVLKWLSGKLKQRASPTAIVAMDDRMALLVMKAANRLGLRVPDEISVLGFDDVPIANLWDPPLTTIRMPMRQIGCVALSRLIQRIDSAELPCSKLMLPIELIVRSSTAPPGRHTTGT